MKVCSFQNLTDFLVLFMFFFASLTLLAVQEKKYNSIAILGQFY